MEGVSTQYPVASLARSRRGGSSGYTKYWVLGTGIQVLGLFFRLLAVHNETPVRAIRRHFELVGVGRGRHDLRDIAALEGLGSHFHFVGPGPGIAFESALGVHDFAHAVEFVIGVDLL